MNKKKVLLALFVLLMIAVAIVGVNAQKTTEPKVVKPAPAVAQPTLEEKCPAPKVVIKERCQNKPVEPAPTPAVEPDPIDEPVDIYAGGK